MTQPLEKRSHKAVAVAMAQQVENRTNPQNVAAERQLGRSSETPPARGTPGTAIFADGLDDGTACAWTTVSGPITPPTTSCPKPIPVFASATYGSEGCLYRQMRGGLPGK